MVAWSLLLSVAYKIASVALHTYMKAIGAVREIVSECGMGCFIAYSSGDMTMLRNQAEMLKAAISAAVKLLTPELIFSCFMREIVQSRPLEAFFSQIDGYDQWKSYMQSYNYAPPPLTWEKFLYYAGGKLLMNPPEKTLEEMTSLTPASLFSFICDRVKECVQPAGDKPDLITNTINALTSMQVSDPRIGYAPEGYWYSARPFMWVEWITIRAAIMVLHVYETIASQGIVGGYPAPYVPKQRVHLIMNDEIAGVLHLKADGSLEVSVPDRPELETLSLDTYGLILPVWTRVRPRLRYVNTTLGFEVKLDDPMQVRQETDEEGYVILYVEDLPPAHWVGEEPDWDDIKIRYKLDQDTMHLQIYEGEISHGCQILLDDEVIWERPEVYHALPWRLVYDKVLYLK